MRLPDTIKSSLARCSMYFLPFTLLQPQLASAPGLEDCLSIPYVSSPQIDAQGKVFSRATVNNSCKVLGSLAARPSATIKYAVFAKKNGSEKSTDATTKYRNFSPGNSYVDGTVQIAGVDSTWNVTSCFKFIDSRLSGQLSHQTNYTCND